MAYTIEMECKPPTRGGKEAGSRLAMTKCMPRKIRLLLIVIHCRAIQWLTVKNKDRELTQMREAPTPALLGIIRRMYNATREVY
jgi:hypothetical protein